MLVIRQYISMSYFLVLQLCFVVCDWPVYLSLLLQIINCKISKWGNTCQPYHVVLLLVTCQTLEKIWSNRILLAKETYLKTVSVYLATDWAQFDWYLQNEKLFGMKHWQVQESMRTAEWSRARTACCGHSCGLQDVAQWRWDCKKHVNQAKGNIQF